MGRITGHMVGHITDEKNTVLNKIKNIYIIVFKMTINKNKD